LLILGRLLVDIVQGEPKLALLSRSTYAEAGQAESRVTSDSDRAAVIIVGFRNADDVQQCVAALARSTATNFDIFVCENGGSANCRNLSEVLLRSRIVVSQDSTLDFLSSSKSSVETEFVSLACYRLRVTAVSLFVAEAAENLGYAGAINAWLRRLLERPEYAGFWILNPDTLVEPDAFSELLKYVKSSGKGMVGCRIVSTDDPSLIQSRGLRWRPFLASTKVVGLRAVASKEPDIEGVEEGLDAPSGASFYVTRDCVERIGLMDERYFLFFEDLDWGIRAKKLCGLGYAHHAVVRHQGGTTIGSASSRSGDSKLTVFLEFRNRILFVRRRYPAWFPWTVSILALRALEYSFAGSLENTKTAYGGIAAGLAGQTGRPDSVIEQHHITAGRNSNNLLPS
jgi:N-acetylglucosaminyl-diphospho-decaprenol L-rhamnosyltransferase